MSTEKNGNSAIVAQEHESPGAIMEAVIAKGDLSKLAPGERAMYYQKTCESMGLNPLTQPLQYVTLNGKLTLYATRTATDQLRKINRVTLEVMSEETTSDGLRVVRVRASTPDGRHDEEIGAVSVAGLKGDQLANAYMKALTKAKRRATLSICGLGWLDESEIESLPASSVKRAPVSSYVPDDEPTVDVESNPYIVEVETGATVDAETGEVVDPAKSKSGHVVDEVAPDDAGIMHDMGADIEREFLDAIHKAKTIERLREIGNKLKDAGISTQELRDTYAQKARQLAKTAQPELVPTSKDPERFTQQ